MKCFFHLLYLASPVCLFHLMLPFSLFCQTPFFEHVYPMVGNEMPSFAVETQGNFLFAGRKSYKLHLDKIDYAGNVLWSKSYPGMWPYPSGLFVLPTGNIWITTSSGILKLNANGDSLDYVGSTTFGASCAVIAGSKDLILGGSVFYGGSTCCDAYLSRMDSSGNTLWTISPGPGRIYAVEMVNDSEFVAAWGYISQGAPYFMFSKYSIGGSRIFENPLEAGESINSIVKKNSGGFAVSGIDWSNNGSVFHEIDDSGYIVSTRKFSSLISIEYGKYLSPAAAGGFYISGSGPGYNGKLTVTRLNDAGDSLYSKSYGDSIGAGTCIIPTSDGGILDLGFHGRTMPDYIVVKWDSNEAGFVSNAQELYSGISFYPNPADEFVIFTSDFKMEKNIELLDLTGRRLRFFGSASGNPLYIGDLPQGIYLLRAGEEYMSKLIISR